METIQAFYDNYTEISIAVVAAIIIAIVIKPKAAGKIVGAIAIILVIGYLILELVGFTGSSMDKKGEAATRTDRDVQEWEKSKDE